MSPDIAELVELYAAERPGLSQHVIAAFIEAGLEPPTVEHVDMLGFSPAERTLIDKYYEKHEPHGSRKDLPAVA